MKTNHFNPDKKNQQAIMLNIQVMAAEGFLGCAKHNLKSQ